MRGKNGRFWMKKRLKRNGIQIRGITVVLRGKAFPVMRMRETENISVNVGKIYFHCREGQIIY